MTIISTTQVRKRYRSADSGCSYTTAAVVTERRSVRGDGRHRSVTVGDGRRIRDKLLCLCFVKELYFLLIRQYSSAGGHSCRVVSLPHVAAHSHCVRDYFFLWIYCEQYAYFVIAVIGDGCFWQTAEDVYQPYECKTGFLELYLLPILNLSRPSLYCVILDSRGVFSFLPKGAEPALEGGGMSRASRF